MHASCAEERDSFLTSQVTRQPPRTGLGAHHPPRGTKPELEAIAKEHATSRYGQPY
jgi:hypothetical protein